MEERVRVDGGGVRFCEILHREGVKERLDFVVDEDRFKLTCHRQLLEVTRGWTVVFKYFCWRATRVR